MMTGVVVYDLGSRGMLKVVYDDMYGKIFW